MKTRRIALLGLLGALSIVLNLFETALLPPTALPVGAKVGLSNVVTMFAAAVLGGWSAIGIAILKSGFVFLTRGATAGIMSLSGGLLSTVLLCFLIRFEGKDLSFIGIGILCAAAHNMGQLCMAAFLSGTASLLSYGKVLLPIALVTGTLTGILLNITLPKLKTLPLFRKQNYTVND